MSVSGDLEALRAFLEDFEAYLKSDTVYWTVRPNLPALTIGGLWLLRRTLGASRGRMSAAEAASFETLEAQANAVYSRWPVNIEKKALKEISARLSQWSGQLDELSENYASAVTPRVHLALLLALAERQPEAAQLQKRLDGLDARLKARLRPGGFVWDPALADAFPRDEFWFLYGRPGDQA